MPLLLVSCLTAQFFRRTHVKLANKNKLSKKKYPTVNTSINNEYKIWVEEFDKKHAEEREEKLEKANIPMDCTKIIFRAPNVVTAVTGGGAVGDAVAALNNYCNSWQKIGKKNLAEKAYYYIYILSTLKLSLPSLPPDKARLVLLGNGPGGLVPLASAAKGLHLEARKLSRIIKDKGTSDPESVAACKKLVNDYKKFAHSKVLLDGGYVELRRGAAALVNSLNNKSSDNIIEHQKAVLNYVPK
ncbi:MAG: hypothetical protein LBR79_04870 [Oscillospiraceae bacterium]|nr:hypothetical protein [Oscillospiraceae bacterium]